MSASGPVRRATTTRDNWETPRELFDQLNAEFRFTLDAAASEDNRKCERWLEGPCIVPAKEGINCYGCCDGPEDFGVTDFQGSRADFYLSRGIKCYCGFPTVCVCGLCADWMEHTVWLNPPYGRRLDRWIAKSAWAAAGGATVVMLLPANTDTGWFQTLWHCAAEIRFLTGRVNFVGTSSGNTGGSVVAVFRPGKYLGPAALLWDWRGDAS